MNAVGIDISKGKSMVCVMRPLGEMVLQPFEINHTESELSQLAKQLKSLDGETRVVMEATGNYYIPVARMLHKAGFYVTVVNAMLIHDYGNNSLRRAKTDKKDAIKLANYALDRWPSLLQYFPEEDTRLALKTCYRQYQQYCCGLTEKAFISRYQKWCKKLNYNFRKDKALGIYAGIYANSCEHVSGISRNDTSKLLVKQAVSQLKAASAALAALKCEMQRLAAELPEYP